MPILTWNGQNIEQRDNDGYVNATQMCQANGKRFTYWMQNESSKAYVEQLSSDVGIPTSELVVTIKGGIPESQGTWIHPLIAIAVGQWISPAFHLWCNKHIKTLMEEGSTTLNNQQVSPIDLFKQMVFCYEQQQLELATIKLEQAQLQESVNEINARSADALKSLKEIPPTDVEVAPITTRFHLNNLVREYSLATNVTYGKVWNLVYTSFRNRYHVDLVSRGKNSKPKLTGVEWAEANGYIEKLYATAQEVLVKQSSVA